MSIRRVVAGLAVVVGQLAPVARAAEPTWTELRTPHFVVLSNAGARETRNVALQFEQFRDVFDQLTKGGIRKGERPITVFALRNENDLRALLPEYWADRAQAKPDGLFVPGRDRHHVALRLDSSKDLANVARAVGFEANPYHSVFHEYVHALLQANVRLPAWLNEGLAEYYAGTYIEKNRVLLGRPHALTILYLRERALLPLAELLAATTESPLYKGNDKVGRFYAQSWALVHYLRVRRPFGEGKEPPIAAYVRQIDAGVDRVAAAQAVFGDLTRLQSDLDMYIRSPVFGMEVFSGTTQVDRSSWIERSPTATDVDVHTARFHVALGHSDLASSLVQRLLAAPTRSAEVYEVAAALACRNDKNTECLAHAKAAIDLGTTSGMTYFLAASAVLNSSDNADLATAQQFLEGSLAREPEFAPAQWTLASVYAATGHPAADALRLAERAIELAPREPEPYLAAAAALMNAGKSAEAIRRAEQGVRYAQTNEARTRARDFLQQLKQTADAPPAVVVPPAPPPTTSQSGDNPDARREVRWGIRCDAKGIDLEAWLKGFSAQLISALEHAGIVFAHTGQMTLSLSIRKNGSLEHVTVARSSGVTTLDEEVRAAVTAMTGVPLPETYPAASMPAELTFRMTEAADAPPKH
jgi:TonB family protein